MDWQKYYTRGRWKGFDNYECALCPYATVRGVSDILTHLMIHFPGKQKSPVLVADSGGNVLGSADEVFAADEEE